MSVFRPNNAPTDRTWSVPQPRPAWTELDEAPTERLYETDPEPEPTDPPPMINTVGSWRSPRWRRISI